MKQIVASFILPLFLGTTTAGCSDNGSSAPDAGIRVKTAEVTAIAADNALSGGRVIGETQTVTEFGICWATDDNPTIDDNRSTVAGDAASFACYATGLEANTTYCLRAYAMTSKGTVYGQTRRFTTLVAADDDTPSVGEDDEQNPMASTIYLWPEGNMAKVTNYTGSQGSYQDPPSFRPYMNYFPVAEGMEIKGTVLVCAGGAFQFRSDRNEGTPVAQWFARHGYQAFVVNYRVQPYRMEEGSLDLARCAGPLRPPACCRLRDRPERYRFRRVLGRRHSLRRRGPQFRRAGERDGTRSRLPSRCTRRGVGRRMHHRYDLRLLRPAERRLDRCREVPGSRNSAYVLRLRHARPVLPSVSGMCRCRARSGCRSRTARIRRIAARLRIYPRGVDGQLRQLDGQNYG